GGRVGRADSDVRRALAKSAERVADHSCQLSGARPATLRRCDGQFSAECRHVLEALAVVYKNDALAREQKLSPQARLEFHRAQSGPVMEELHAWLVRQFDQRLVEPNSALGKAISYLLKHWAKRVLPASVQNLGGGR